MDLSTTDSMVGDPGRYGNVRNRLAHMSHVYEDPAVAERTSPALTEAWLSFLASTSHCEVGRVVYYALLKRGLDLALSALALVAVGPLLVLTALIIWLDSGGPIIFRQTRIGQGGRPFVVYKFRTMVVQDIALRLFQTSDGQLRHKIQEDPRVTRAGKLLRRTSIDELPQLVNVVKGEMSLIGPRPELPQIVDQYAAWQHRRHLVRPGLTGWWQIQGRSDQPMHEHTELDLYYVTNLSWRLDLQIMRRTIRVVLSGFGAF